MSKASAPAERLLLVDDHPDNLLALAATLEPLGYELVSAGSGAEALRLLLHEEVSAVVLDVQMPDLDGFETAALMRSRGATSSVPILFLTAVGHSVEHELRSYEVGGFDYICKPFDPRALRAKVRAIVEWSSRLRALQASRSLYADSAAALAESATDAAADPPGGGGAGAAAMRAARRLVDLDLDATPRAPSAARDAVRVALSGCPEGLVEQTLLLVSELVTNALVHTASTPSLRLDLGPEVLRVEVCDAGTPLASQLAPDLLDESGRGLQIVSLLADRCGWTELGAGKCVWFEIDRSPQPGAGARR